MFILLDGITDKIVKQGFSYCIVRTVVQCQGQMSQTGMFQPCDKILRGEGGGKKGGGDSGLDTGREEVRVDTSLFSGS